MFIVYILKSAKDGRTYVGHTSNFRERLDRHNKGGVRSTKHRRPLRVIKTEELQTLAEAKARELWWKSSSGRKELKRFFA